MDKGFLKFKKKIMLEVLIKSIIVALSLGIITFSIPTLYNKIKELDFNFMYLIIGVIVMIISFLITFLILKPNKIKIAKRIDKEFQLNEKVLTMVEYENEDSFMSNIQREDTLNILSNISVKKLSMKFSIVFFIIMVLALSSGITALAYPSKPVDTPIVEDPGEDDLDFEFDNWQKMALLGLIETVESSDINETLKAKYIDKLNELLNALDDASKQSEMKQIVNDVIVNVQLELDLVNSNNEIFQVLRASTNSIIRQLGVKINVLNSTDVIKVLDNIRLQIASEPDNITELDEGFGKLLRDSNLDLNDELSKLIYDFSDDLRGLRGEANIDDAINQLILNYEDDIKYEIDYQLRNKEIADFIENELIMIFNLIEEDNTNDDQSSTDDEFEDEEDDLGNNEGSSSGGLGTGDVLFGSDDLFFDPNEGVVEYGDVITQYYGQLLQRLEDGTISEEYRNYLEKYFDILFGDFNKESE